MTLPPIHIPPKVPSVRPLDPQPAKIVIDGSFGDVVINHLVITEEQARLLAAALQEALTDIASNRALRRTISLLSR